MKNHFFVLILVLTTISFFSCKEKALSDEDFEKLMFDVTDSLAAVSVIPEIKFSSVPFDQTSNNIQSMARQLDLHFRTANFECDGILLEYTYESLINPIAHTVTGGNPPMRFNPGIETMDQGSNNGNSDSNQNCAPIGLTTNVEVMLEIKVPCNKIVSISDMTLISKLFENSTEIDNNLSSLLIGNRSSGMSSTDIDTFQVNGSIIPKEHFVKCGNTGNCVIHVYVSASIVPKSDLSGQPKKYTFAFQIRDQDAIGHTHSSGVTHNMDENITTFSDRMSKTPQVNNLRKTGLILSKLQYTTWYNSTCNRIPITLQDFKNCDSSDCNHMADHTYLIQLPVCPRPNPSSPENDDLQN